MSFVRPDAVPARNPLSFTCPSSLGLFPPFPLNVDAVGELSPLPLDVDAIGSIDVVADILPRPVSNESNLGQEKANSTCRKQVAFSESIASITRPLHLCAQSGSLQR